MSVLMSFLIACCAIFVAVDAAVPAATASAFHEKFIEYLRKSSTENTATFQQASLVESQSLRGGGMANPSQFKYLKATFFGDGQCSRPVLGVSQYALNRCVPWSSDRSEERHPDTKYAWASAEISSEGNLAVRFQYYADSHCKQQTEKFNMMKVPGEQQCAYDREDQSMRFTLSPDATNYFGLDTNGIAWTFHSTKAKAENNKQLLSESFRVIYFPGYNWDCFYSEEINSYMRYNDCSSDTIYYTTYGPQDENCQGQGTPMTKPSVPVPFTEQGVPHIWQNFVCSHSS